MKISSAKTTQLEPLLKWAGGKRLLLKHLIPLVPSTYKTYYEPFLGGAALFFAIRPTEAVLSDANPDLIHCYLQLKNAPTEVIRALRRMPNGEESYYRIRKKKYRSAATKAAQFVYLTKLSFNGLYRVNLRGEFNVPYGQKVHIIPCEPDKMKAASKVLQNAQIRCSDFEKVTQQAKCDDFVYMDPPYTAAHSDNGFLKYNATIFSWKDQIRLSQCAMRLADRGCRVIVSNASHDSVRELYREFKTVDVSRPSIIAASSAHRKEIIECIFYEG
jgi:DNA adenine methylase